MQIVEIQDLKDAFDRQAKTCIDMNAPFTGRVCRILGQHLDDSTGFGARVLSWPLDTLRADLVPLRCCAALNLNVRRGNAPELARFYPPNDGGADQAFWSAAEAVIRQHDAAMTQFLHSAPQTNEVARSGVLLAGFLKITEATGMPLALYELGASAGLNLIFDAYRYDLGEGRSWGAEAAGVLIPCSWSGAAPALEQAIRVASRAAVDLNPISASSGEDRERLLSYIWPEQTDRVTRIEAALGMFAAQGLEVEAGDALQWAHARLAMPQESGTCRVFFHSVFMQYLPQQLRQGLRTCLQEAGAAATLERPFAWLAMEGAAEAPHTCQLSLTLWPGGERRVLAHVDWHGKWARFT